MSAVKNDLVTITNALNSANPGVFLREAAKTALGRVKEHIAFDRTQREFLAADLVALAEGKPVRTALAAAVENKIKLLKLETEAACSMLLDVQQEAIASAKQLAELESQHVCGLSGYNPMIDPPCPACEAKQ